MPIITSIEPQKNQKRVNIYLDNKFGFGLDLENFVKYRLKTGKELTEEEIGKIIKTGEFQKILDKLLRFSMLRPRSEKEVNDYLKRKKVHESLYNDLFERLNHLELIDDKKFAKWWVNQRLEFRSKSKKDLIFELRQKGISKEIIDNVLKSLDIDETKIAKSLIKKKRYRWERLDEKTKKVKISQYLASKGFDWQTINKVVG